MSLQHLFNQGVSSVIPADFAVHLQQQARAGFEQSVQN